MPIRMLPIVKFVLITIALALVWAVAARGQDAKPKTPTTPTVPPPTLSCSAEHPEDCLVIATTTDADWLDYPTWTEKVKDGHYTATFDDPDNKWRCYVTTYAAGTNGSVTILCARPHKVNGEK